MLKQLQKFFNTALAEEEEVNMTTKEDKPELAAVEQSASLQALLESATAALSQTQTKLSEMSALYEQAQAALAAADVAKAALVAEAAEKRLAARKQTIVAAIGTAKADALLEATEGLDDKAFSAVVGAMAVSLEVEANSESFKEVGTAAPEDKTLVEATQEESPEAKLLREKYNQTK